VILNCSDSSVASSVYTWDFTGIGQAVRNIATGCQTQPSDPTYSVESPTASSCNLILNSATVEQAGLYQCSGPPAKPSAQVIVLATIPTCTTDPTDEVLSTEAVKFTCSVNAVGSTQPKMTWYDQINYIGTQEANYTISEFPTGSTVPEYTCHTHFDTINLDGATATNPPMYSSICKTSPLNVVSSSTTTSSPTGRNYLFIVSLLLSLSI